MGLGYGSTKDTATWVLMGASPDEITELNSQLGV